MNKNSFTKSFYDDFRVISCEVPRKVSFPFSVSAPAPPRSRHLLVCIKFRTLYQWKISKFRPSLEYEKWFLNLIFGNYSFKLSRVVLKQLI